MSAAALAGSPPLAYAGQGSALLFFLLYLGLTIGIGIWAAYRGRGTQEDYFLGSRGLSPLSMALSAVGSGRSAWLVLGASAAAWKLGLAALWLFPGYILAELFLFVGLGPRLRRRSAAVGAITLPEFFERESIGAEGGRGSTGLPLRPLAGAVTILFLLTYVSAQLVAGGKTLHAIFDVDGETWGLALTAAIVLVYTILGGYRAVVITDVFQALFMLAGLVVLPLLGLAHIGGFGALAEALRAVDPQLLRWTGGGLPLIGGLAIGLGSFGNPHILVRHMTLRDPREAHVAAAVGTGWNVVMAAGALLMGLVGRAIYPSAEAFPGGDVDYLFPTLAQQMSGEYLFAGFLGVLLATLFAAVMSTCDSQLLVIASSMVRDFRGRERVESSASRTAGSRVTVALAVLVAAALSYGASRQVHPFVLLSWGALGAAFGPATFLLLYDPRTSARGLLAAVVVGIAVFASGDLCWDRPAGVSSNIHLIPAFLAAGLSGFALRHRGGE